MGENEIRERYLDPSKPGSFSSFENFMKNNNFHDISKVKRTLENLITYSTHRKPKIITPRRKVLTTFKGNLFAADLADVRELSPRINKSTKYILVIIELLSKMIYLYPIKNKSGPSVAAAFNEFFNENPEFRNCRIWSDMGMEFRSSVTTTVLRKYGSKIYHSLNMVLKASPAERAIRTLKKRIYMFIDHTKTKKYIHILRDLQNSLNNEYKPSIGMKPSEVVDTKTESLAWANQFLSLAQTKHFKQKIPVPSYVRILNSKLSFFSKSYGASYGKPIFKVIKAISYHPIFKYILQDPDTKELLPGSFYDFELQIVPSKKNNDE